MSGDVISVVVALLNEDPLPLCGWKTFVVLIDRHMFPLERKKYGNSIGGMTEMHTSTLSPFDALH